MEDKGNTVPFKARSTDFDRETKTSNYARVEDSTTTAGTPSNVTYYIQAGCPYEFKCTDYGKRCDSCRHGRRSYYEPNEPYYPYIPYIPYYPYPYHPWEITWYTTTTYSDDIGDDLTMPITSCYAII